MEPLDFLAAVLPTSGKYCTFALKGKRNIFSTTPEELYDTTKRISDAGEEAWFALGSFDDSGHRKAENAQYMRSFFMDLDCGKDVKTGEERAFPNKKAAVLALEKFLEDSGLGMLGKPWLIDSGGGVHPYWPTTQDIPISVWKPVAEQLKVAAFEHNFAIDTTVTADAARVLRLPGTHNNKTTPRPVRVVQQGDIFDFHAIQQALERYKVKTPPKATPLAILGTAPKGTMSSVAAALVSNSVTKFRTIMLKTEQGAGCGQLANYIENASDDGMEPIWRGMLSWAKPCIDGDKAAKILSRMHPYDEDRMYQKLNEIKGPYACASMNTIQQGICEGCTHWGKITNPLALGRELAVSTEEVFVEVNEEVPARARPNPPRGYDYASHGGIVYHKPAGRDKNDFAKDIQLTAYDIFLSRVFLDGQEHRAEFTVIKKNTTLTFVIDTRLVPNDGQVLATLAANNVHSMLGAGTSKYLVAYIQACVADHSNDADNVVKIPPKFGWQPDNSFAIGDMVYSADSPSKDYNFSSAKLHNVMQATATQGEHAEWAEAFKMFRRRKAWGHLAGGMHGFASILMHFMPKGTNSSTFHVCQETSAGGKTAILTLAASVLGDPKLYFVGAKTSETTMMQRAGLLGSNILIVDEITNNQTKTNHEWGPQFVFDFANGAHKIKGSHAGNSEISNDILWDSLAMCSSNMPMLEFMVGVRKATSHGEVKRFLEWAMPAHYKFEMNEEEMEIYKKLYSNNGVAGRMFIKWCVRNLDTVREECAKWLSYWREYSAAKGDERFWSSQIAANLAACVICHKAGIIDIPVAPIQEFWLERVKTMRAIIDGSVTSAEDLLDRYVADNNGNFVRVQSGAVVSSLLDFGKIRPDSPKGAIRGRIEYNTTPGYVDIYIEEKLLKVFCSEVNRSYISFVNELESSVLLRQHRYDLLAGTNGPHLRVKCLKISRKITPDDKQV